MRCCMFHIISYRPRPFNQESRSQMLFHWSMHASTKIFSVYFHDRNVLSKPLAKTCYASQRLRSNLDLQYHDAWWSFNFLQAWISFVGFAMCSVHGNSTCLFKECEEWKVTMWLLCFEHILMVESGGYQRTVRWWSFSRLVIFAMQAWEGSDS